MKFYGELLIFALLFITNIRVFFVNHVRRDPLVCLAPFTFIMAIFQVFNWGLNIFNGIGLILSFLVLLSNFHALFRYSERLFVDHYSPLMKIWALVTCILTGIAFAGTFFFAPADLNNNTIELTETKIRLKGSFTAGFEAAKPFEVSNATITEFSMFPDFDGRTEVILFIPDKRSDTYYYRPYLQLLSKEGLTVCSADFFSNDCRWIHTFEDAKIFRRFSLVLKSITNNQWFMAQREYYTYNISLELKALYELLDEHYGQQCKFFIISDSMGNTAVDDFIKAHPDRFTGKFELNSIPEYKTPGYGVIEQTDPLLYQILGNPKERGISDFLIPRFMVRRTIEKINEIMGFSL